MLIYLHIVESRFCYTALYFCTKVLPRFCAKLALLKLLMPARGTRSCSAGDYTAVPTACLGHSRYSGQCWQEAAVGLAPSLNNSAATQQELHFYFVSASISRHKAKVQNVLCAHSCLFWMDFLGVSLIGMLIMASFSNTH